MNIPSETKVAFVEPMGAYSNVFADYMTIPMLGPLYLGSIAEDAGFDVVILNENILKRQVHDNELADIDILCISCMTATIERGKEISHRYKAIREEKELPSRSIIGGIHASMIPEDVINDFDQVFVGEAETKIVDLLKGKIKAKIVQGEPLQSLDSIPIPNFELIKGKRKLKTKPIMTSRGCPYNCTFCSVTEMFGRGYRTMSVDRVIEQVKAHDASWLFFVDDHFVVKKDRTREILDRMEEENIRTKWSCQLRADVSRDEELVSRMADNGCKTVYIGFESINPDSLKDIQKAQSVEDIENAARVFKENGILVHGMFMLGSDSDKEGIFESTSKFCREAGLSSVQYLILTPLPGTEFYRKIESEGRLLHKKWDFYDAMHVVFEPKNFTPSELQEGMIECFHDFYSYSHAFNDALDIFFRTVGACCRSLVEKARFPNIESALVKAFGKHIVRKWIQFNRPYLGYLKIQSIGEKHRLSRG